MRFLFTCLLAAAVVAGADKAPPSGQVTGEAAEIKAKIYSSKEEVMKLLGSDLGGGIMVVELTVIPRGEDDLMISHDDFTLRSEKDGQKSQPFVPSQIAGNQSLVVSTTGGAGVYSQDRGPVWGGMGGGRPGMMGNQGTGVGNGAAQTQAKAAVTDNKETNPLLALLEEKILPEKKTGKPVSGLLYFHLEGKHKPKELELLYRTPLGRLSVRFK